MSSMAIGWWERPPSRCLPNRRHRPASRRWTLRSGEIQVSLRASDISRTQTPPRPSSQGWGGIHLNMIGIRNSHKGQGLARPILDAVHQMSDADPNSTGVSLTTERDRNVKLHEHFGYGVIAHKQVSDGIQTWGLFRRITE